MRAKRDRTKGLLIPLLVLAAACLPASAQPRKLKPGFNLFTKEQDVQLGKEAAAQVEKQMNVVSNQELQSFVDRIGGKLAEQPESDSKSFPYVFKVVHEKSINAFALPGGRAFIHTGLIDAVENEAQLAGVLAHEISHVALRHGTNQVSKANLIQLPAALAGSLAGGSLLGQLTQLGIGLGANSLLLKFSRNAERDADLLGTRIMSGAGYDPLEMARFFEKLAAEGGPRSKFEQFLSDHPNPGNRVKAVEDEIRYLPERTYIKDTGQLPRIKQVLARLPVPPQKPAAGVAAGSAGRMPDIRPPDRYRQYRGKTLSISYPDQWEVFESRNSPEVTLAPREGLVQTQDGNVALGYGLILSVYWPESGRVDLQRDTERLVRQLQQSNPGMRVSGESSKSRAGGAECLVTTLISASPYQGEKETDVLVTVARSDGLVYLVFACPQSQYRNVEGMLQEMLRSIRWR